MAGTSATFTCFSGLPVGAGVGPREGIGLCRRPRWMALRLPFEAPLGQAGPTGSKTPKGQADVTHPLALRSFNQRCSELKFGYESPPLPKGAKKLGFVEGICGASGCPLIRYRCGRGHIVKAVVGSAAGQVWCPACIFECFTPGISRHRRKFDLPSMKILAASRGGRCLSQRYISVRDPLEWQCHLGHRWFANADNMRQKGTWCPQCARLNKKLSIEHMQLLAKERGGRCLSAQYSGSSSKLSWQCEEGHTFDMAPNNIRRKPGSSRKPSWCPICSLRLRGRRRSR
mmetsp:Transcript_2954/g.5624  ORF Transcript_2954/g.5624 Transcript_2954/m.5624 type:complete len:286 (+) Transcript_2954:3204-4061(+)